MFGRRSIRSAGTRVLPVSPQWQYTAAYTTVTRWTLPRSIPIGCDKKCGNVMRVMFSKIIYTPVSLLLLLPYNIAPGVSISCKLTHLHSHRVRLTSNYYGPLDPGKIAFAAPTINSTRYDLLLFLGTCVHNIVIGMIIIV